MWEVDTSQPERVGDYVIARDLESIRPAAREWHLVRTDFLKLRGVPIENFGTEWEVDWSKRDGMKVWARNPTSKRIECREWRWVAYGTLRTAGIKWESRQTGRHLNRSGYWMLTRAGMSAEDIQLAEQHELFQRTGNMKVVLEHRLVALKKYGAIPKGSVVRHMNGDKLDNRPENLVLGTHKENHTDHRTAVLQMMYWRERAQVAERKLAELGIET